MFLASRYFLGFGISVAAVAAPALVAELSYPSHRGRITALYNTNWFVGSISAGKTLLRCFLVFSEVFPLTD
jgi:MFS family permease